MRNEIWGEKDIKGWRHIDGDETRAFYFEGRAVRAISSYGLEGI